MARGGCSCKRSDASGAAKSLVSTAAIENERRALRVWHNTLTIATPISASVVTLLRAAATVTTAAALHRRQRTIANNCPSHCRRNSH